MISGRRKDPAERTTVVGNPKRFDGRPTIVNEALTRPPTQRPLPSYRPGLPPSNAPLAEPFFLPL